MSAPPGTAVGDVFSEFLMGFAAAAGEEEKSFCMTLNGAIVQVFSPD